MRFNIKQFNYKRLYIHFCFLVLLNVFFSTENIEAKTFSVNDIEISTPFEINFDKNKIIDEGFAQAFNRLILSILQTQDQKKLSETPIGLIKSMIETFSIQEEKFINEVYYLSLNVSFNKKKILNLMEKKNIFPSLPVEKKIFFLFKKFNFKNFLDSQDFVNKVGIISENEGHHPDISFGWGYAEIKITTHAIKGISENDFILAAKIDHLTNV